MSDFSPDAPPTGQDQEPAFYPTRKQLMRRPLTCNPLPLTRPLDLSAAKGSGSKRTCTT